MFDIVFAQLGVIPRIRNKIVEIVAVAERNFMIGHVKHEESKKQPFCVNLADGRMPVKKGKIFSYLNYNIVSLGKMAGKQKLLAIEKICCCFE